MLTTSEACERYSLDLEELTCWRRSVDRSGMLVFGSRASSNIAIAMSARIGIDRRGRTAPTERWPLPQFNAALASCGSACKKDPVMGVIGV